MGRIIVASLAICLTVTAAQAQIRVRSVDDLRKDDAVQQRESVYIALAPLSVVHDRCDEELAIDAARKARDLALFATAGQDYMQAYDAAYRAQVGTPPPAEVSQAYVKRAQKYQQEQVDRAARFIAASGCKNGVVERILEYADRQSAYQEQLKATANDATKKKTGWSEE